jgi:TRAP-type transport system periplasmic protein
MKTMRKIALLAALAAVAIASAAAKPVTLKLATAVPENTPWGQGLDKLAADWLALSEGLVVLKVFHGTHGDTGSIRQKMDIGTLDAGVFDSVGLHMISPEVLALSIPSMIRDDKELDFVLAKADEYMRKKLDEKGYKLLAWSKAGWIRFFSKRPVVTPGDLKRMKLGVNANDQELQQAFKAQGYDIVPASMTSMVQALSTGAVDAFYTSPLLISTQWSAFAGLSPYMTAQPVAPFVGVVLMRKSSWAKIPDELKPKLALSLAAIAKQIDAEVAKKEAAGIAAMVKLGLKVPPLTPEAKAEWEAEYGKGMESGLGAIFPAEMVGLVSSALAEYRKSKK